MKQNLRKLQGLSELTVYFNGQLIVLVHLQGLLVEVGAGPQEARAYQGTTHMDLFLLWIVFFGWC